MNGQAPGGLRSAACRTAGGHLRARRSTSRRNAILDRRALKGIRWAPTRSEELLWRALRGRQLGVTFRRQVVLLGRFVADFYAAEVRLVVEVDGAWHDGRREGRTRGGTGCCGMRGIASCGLRRSWWCGTSRRRCGSSGRRGNGGDGRLRLLAQCLVDTPLFARWGDRDPKKVLGEAERALPCWWARSRDAAEQGE